MISSAFRECCGDCVKKDGWEGVGCEGTRPGLGLSCAVDFMVSKTSHGPGRLVGKTDVKQNSHRNESMIPTGKMFLKKGT